MSCHVISFAPLHSAQHSGAGNDVIRNAMQ